MTYEDSFKALSAWAWNANGETTTQQFAARNVIAKLADIEEACKVVEFERETLSAENHKLRNKLTATQGALEFIAMWVNDQDFRAKEISGYEEHHAWAPCPGGREEIIDLLEQGGVDVAELRKLRSGV